MWTNTAAQHRARNQRCPPALLAPENAKHKLLHQTPCPAGSVSHLHSRDRGAGPAPGAGLARLPVRRKWVRGLATAECECRLARGQDEGHGSTPTPSWRGAAGLDRRADDGTPDVSPPGGHRDAAMEEAGGHTHGCFSFTPLSLGNKCGWRL
ncbi:hypothetical protein MDA_GLEAN10010211 [Myotis davidii]|uniref:Uncharacterized protein n=1 Tax=Myotis davidii TaxID=225400 RepID=L5MJ83_MYODS|nr:hypothetical protein MDA_GLEAN10010211 [Myotis davidii]